MLHCRTRRHDFLHLWWPVLYYTCSAILLELLTMLTLSRSICSQMLFTMENPTSWHYMDNNMQLLLLLFWEPARHQTIFLFQQIQGLPASINTKKELCDFLSRMISHLTIQHAAVNYELVDYASHIPNIPTKMYNDTRVEEGEFSVYRLPNRNTSSVSLLMYCLVKPAFN